MSEGQPTGTAAGKPGVERPAPTAWPLVAAFGVALGGLGLVTHPALGLLGVALMLVGAIGGVRQVIPVERLETVALHAEPPPPRTRARALPRLGEQRHRMRIPTAIHPYSAGAWGGLAGGAAMAAVAMAYGLAVHGSPWLPINLLAAVALPSLAHADVARLCAFSWSGLLLAGAIHLLLSLGVGLLYAVLLPMLPGRGWPWGALLAPLLWSGLLHSTLSLIDPALAARIDWAWFVASQAAFGVVTGLAVERSERIDVLQRLPFAERAGLEMDEGEEDEP